MGWPHRDAALPITIRSIRAVVFDVGGVLVDSPLHIIGRYEQELGLSPRSLGAVIAQAGDSVRGHVDAVNPWGPSRPPPRGWCVSAPCPAPPCCVASAETLHALTAPPTAALTPLAAAQGAFARLERGELTVQEFASPFEAECRYAGHCGIALARVMPR